LYNQKIKAMKHAPKKHGSGFISGKSPSTKLAKCPSYGFVSGHSNFGGKSPSTKVKLQK